jgi:hypothetical protein
MLMSINNATDVHEKLLMRVPQTSKWRTRERTHLLAFQALPCASLGFSNVTGLTAATFST